MDNSLPTTALLLAAFCMTAAADEPPPSKPPTNLAELARHLKLREHVHPDVDGRITINNETVATLAESARVTVGRGSTRAPSNDWMEESDEGDRVIWRKRYERQQAKIDVCERRLAAVDRDIDLLNRQRLTPRVLARLETAQAKRIGLEEDLREQRGELARLIREARRHGAQPGWFR
jgi:hypothetical protein